MNDVTQLTWLFPVLVLLGVVAVGVLFSFIPVRLTRFECQPAGSALPGGW
jgi:hypothetical protein